MSRTYIILFAAIYLYLLMSITGVSLAQTVLFEETFAGGNPQLTWFSRDGVSQLQIATGFSNPSGDGTVGFVTGSSQVGNTGSIIAGTPTLTDYEIEAQVYLIRNASAGSGTNNGIFGRFKIQGQSFSAYLLNSDFDSNPRLRLRKFEAGAPPGTPPTVIRDWSPAEIPGGLPSEDSWHKLALEFQGDQIWAYYDDQLLPGSPFTDTESDSGYFGIYCFTGFDTPADSATYFDDVIVTGLTTSIEDVGDHTLPHSFRLSQNYPNPFNPSTNIQFELDKALNIALEIFNIQGQRVAIPQQGLKPAGSYQITWNANGLPAGTYLLRLQAMGQSVSRKMLLIK